MKCFERLAIGSSLTKLPCSFVIRLPAQQIHSKHQSKHVQVQWIGHGWFSTNDETEYREDIEWLATWCQDNNLSITVSKTKKLVIDFRKQNGGHAPVCINDAEVETVEIVTFLGMMITINLSWSTHIEAMVKKAQQ
eukprot:g26341.t1